MRNLKRVVQKRTTDLENLLYVFLQMCYDKRDMNLIH